MADKEKEEKKKSFGKIYRQMVCAIGLREALDKFNVIFPGGNAEDKINALRMMQEYHPHSIELWENVAEGNSDFRKSDAAFQFNCFMFCLDIR